MTVDSSTKQTNISRLVVQITARELLKPKLELKLNRRDPQHRLKGEVHKHEEGNHKGND